MVGGPGDLRSVVNSNMSTFVRVTGVVLCTSLVSLALAVGVDQHLHRKFDSVGALNYRGYRGDVVGEKQQGERRVGVFGSSVAMGYGVAPDKSIAGLLQSLLNQSNDSRFTVVNLAATGDHGLGSFADNYRAFEYVQLDTIAFLYVDPLYDVNPTCRVDSTSVRDWQAFIGALMRHHKTLASSSLSAAGMRTLADARSADGNQRERFLEAFTAVLHRRDAVDIDRFTKLERSYLDVKVPDRRPGRGGVMEPPSLERMSCLLNLLLLKATLGHVIEPVDGVEQMAPSRRTSNPIFRRFNYWFILDEIAWEKYFLLRYGDISEGYRTDPLLQWTARVRERIRQLGSTGAAPRGADTRPYTSTDFFRGVIGQGKRVHLLLFPSTDPDFHAALRMYFDYRFGENDAIRVVDLSAAFLPEEWDSYFLDGLHFSSRGNQVAAQALFDSLTGDALAQ